MALPKNTKHVTHIVGSDQYAYEIIEVSENRKQIKLVDLNKRKGVSPKVILLVHRYGSWWRKEEGEYTFKWDIISGAHHKRDRSF